MTSPKRIQLRRTKGWRKPDGSIVVSRPSRWGNPFTVASCIETGFADNETDARRVCVEAFRSWLIEGPSSPWWFDAGKERFVAMRTDLPALIDHDLACWCPLAQPCHADILLNLANSNRRRADP